MFNGIEEKTYMNHWYDWAAESPEKEKLFYEIHQLVNDMIKELVPREIEKYKSDLIINVIAQMDGKKGDFDGLASDIARLLNQ